MICTLKALHLEKNSLLCSHASSEQMIQFLFQVSFQIKTRKSLPSLLQKLFQLVKLPPLYQ
uniref:Uncharacterized protein n=1 Tax=Lepeophtheirus salmonis TaxID=72036 RepID=A0A0K2TG40_LEPSM